MSQVFRVIQTLETRERTNAFEGSADECEMWLDGNADLFPEPTFDIEIVDDDGNTGWEEEEDNECPHCAGTGEGQYDGARCSSCRGRGYFVNKSRNEP